MINGKETYKKLANWIYCILYNSSIDFFWHDQKFILLFEKQLFFLSYLEKKYSEVVDLGSKFQIKSLISNYNQKMNKNFVLPKETKTISNDNLDDEINYLFIYCRNVFKIDLNELAKKNLFFKKKTIETNESNDFSRINNQQKFNIFGNTNMKIFEQIRAGKIFIYTSRPKIIPILKKIFLFFLLVNMLLIVFMIAISIRINGLYLSNGNTVNTQWNVVNYFFALFLDLSFFSKFIQELNKNHNDNTKYYFQWRSTLLIFASNFFSFIYIDFNFFKMFEIYDKTELAKDFFLHFSLISFKYVWFTIIFILIAIFLVTLLAMHYNPKKNIAMIKKLFEQQINEINKNKENAN